MNYVIFDLEWDSVFYKPKGGFFNQILQIGAVKLNENSEITDEMSVTVRSSVSKNVTKRFSLLTGITSEQMRNGISYGEAIKKFNAFVSDADVTMTWSDSDLYTIIGNEVLLKPGETGFLLKNYFDLQKLVQNKMRTMGYASKNQVSLKDAADFFGLDISGIDLHTACGDSKVCALLFKLCRDDDFISRTVQDTGNPKFREKLCFKPYHITNIKNKSIDENKMRLFCPVCNTELKRTSPWKYIKHAFQSKQLCTTCKEEYIGRIVVKMLYNGAIYKKRVIKPVREEYNDEMPSVPKTV